MATSLKLDFAFWHAMGAKCWGLVGQGGRELRLEQNRGRALQQENLWNWRFFEVAIWENTVWEVGKMPLKMTSHQRKRVSNENFQMNRGLQWESTGVLNWKDLEISNEKGVFSEKGGESPILRACLQLKDMVQVDSKSSLKTDSGSLMKIS